MLPMTEIFWVLTIIRLYQRYDSSIDQYLNESSCSQIITFPIHKPIQQQIG